MKRVILILFLLLTIWSCNTVSNNYSLTDDIYTADFNRLFDNSKYHKITIEITESEWQKLNQNMRDYFARFNDLRSDIYSKANFRYEDESGIVEVKEIGFRTKGNLSRVIPEENGILNLSHFKIKFNETFSYEEESKNYKILKKRTVFDVKEINLKYNRNNDETYISELYSYELFNKVGVFAPKATLVDFYIKIGQNLHHYGIYTLFESIDDTFFEKRLNSDELDGNLYKCLWQQFGPASLTPITNSRAIGIKDVGINYRPAYDLKTNKKDANFNDLKDFIQKLNDINDTEFEDFIENNFEVDNFLKLLAMGVLIGNPDDYRSNANNYYLYHNPKTEKFMMIPFDYDHSLGQGWQSDSLPNYSIESDIYNWGKSTSERLPLVERILNIPKYQIKYEGYLAEFIDQGNGIFKYSQFRNKVNQFKVIYQDYISSSMQDIEFGERNAYWYFQEKVSDINNQLLFYQRNPLERGIK